MHKEHFSKRKQRLGRAGKTTLIKDTTFGDTSVSQNPGGEIEGLLEILRTITALSY